MGKANSLEESAWKCYGLTRKNQSKLAVDKHSSFFYLFFGDEEKSLMTGVSRTKPFSLSLTLWQNKLECLSLATFSKYFFTYK